MSKKFTSLLLVFMGSLTGCNSQEVAVPTQTEQAENPVAAITKVDLKPEDIVAETITHFNDTPRHECPQFCP